MAAAPAALQRILSATRAPRRSGRVLLEQRGEMRLRPGAAWVPFTAEQWIATDDVAFCWHARVRVLPLVTMVVEDAYADGRGRLDVKLWGALRVMHAAGPDLDRGEAQRYLAELPFAPSAMRSNPSLRFEAPEGDDGRVRVRAHDPDAWVDLHVDDAGDVTRTFTPRRPRGDDGPTPWEGRYHDATDWDGVRIPRRAEVAWLLPEGRFDYWRGEITALRHAP